MGPKYIFSSAVRKACWNQAQKVLGRDPARWRYDAAQVPVLKALSGKTGIRAWNFDHIIPGPKAGDKANSLENCQILQSLTNIRKSNKCLTTEQLKEISCDIELNDAGLDIAEVIVHGNIKNEKGKMKCTCVSKAQAMGDRIIQGNIPACKAISSMYRPAVSRYCGKHLHVELRKHPKFRRYPTTALEETILRMDEKMRSKRAGKELSGYGGTEYWDGYREALHGQRGQKLPYAGPLNDGCTTCVVLIRGNQIIVGNAGDSRCVLSRNNLPVVLSTDFKPDLPGERQRIENAGRAVTITEARGNIPRIDAGIAVSRTLGDFAYKNNENLPAIQQAVTALPEVRVEYINHDSQFLILACGGLWDCMTNQQAVDYVRKNLAASILDHCVALPRGRDNMTVMLVRFKTTGAGQDNELPPPPPPVPQGIVLPAGVRGDQVPLAASAAGEASGLHSQMVPLSMRTQKEPTSTSSDPPTPNWGSAAEGRALPTVRSRSRTHSPKSSGRSSKSSEL